MSERVIPADDREYGFSMEVTIDESDAYKFSTLFGCSMIYDSDDEFLGFCPGIKITSNGD